jgi:hypothetical protein
MNQYIITEEQLQRLVMDKDSVTFAIENVVYEVRSHPYQSERDKVLELLDGLRKYANGEYKEADLSDNEHDLRIHLEYENRIWGIMKGLQQQAGEP